MTRSDEVYCFLDTSVFLQCTFFPEVNWPKLLNARRVYLLVTLVVLDELDKHKTDPTSRRRRDRARKVIQEFKAGAARGHQHEDGDIIVRDSVVLRLLDAHPRMNEHPTLDPANNDDRIIASALDACQDYSSPIVVCSADYAMQLRAERRGLLVLAPSDDLMLPDEPDDMAKENIRLRREIDDLRRHLPKLDVRLMVGAKDVEAITITPCQLRNLEVDDYRRYLEQEAATLKHTMAMERQIRVSMDASIELSPITQRLRDDLEDIITHIIHSDGDLMKREDSARIYLRRYCEYLYHLCNYAAWRAQLQGVRFRVHNVGTAVVEDVFVDIIFPDTCTAHAFGHGYHPPSKPHKPVITSTGIVGFSTIGSTSLYDYGDVLKEPAPMPEQGYDELLADPRARRPFKGPKVDPYAPWRVQFEIPRIMHNIPVALSTFIVSIPASEDAAPITVQCRVHAPALAEPIQVGLSIVTMDPVIINPWV